MNNSCVQEYFKIFICAVEAVNRMFAILSLSLCVNMLSSLWTSVISGKYLPDDASAIVKNECLSTCMNMIFLEFYIKIQYPPTHTHGEKDLNWQ